MALSEQEQAFFKAINGGDADTALGMLAKDPELAHAKNGDGNGPISVALFSFNRPVADQLAAAGVSPTFFECCALGNLEGIARGLDADPGLANAFAPDGFTPLTLAAAFGGPDAVRELVKRGADPELRARHAFIKVVPLHAAVFGNRTDVVAALLESGADANAVQPGGFTALHGAAQNGNAPMAKALLAAGAKRDAMTDEGKSAADLAREAGHLELAESLR